MIGNKEVNMKYTCEIENLTKAHPTDAGYDLRSIEDITINANSSAIINTGCCVEIPKGFVGIVKGRSGLTFTSHTEMCNAGVIDADYRGEIKVKIHNLNDYALTFRRGERIAQMIVIPCLLESAEKVDSLDDTSRGTGGFGSSGRY